MARSPRLRFAATSVAVVATLVLAGCGDDDDDTSSTDVDVTLSTEIPDVTASQDTVTTDSAGSAPTSGSGEVGSRDDYIAAAQDEISSEFDDDEVADCVGEAMISEDVFAAIVEAGLTVEEFSENGPSGVNVDESAAADVADEFAACGELREQLAADDDELVCIEDNLSNDQVAEFLAYTLLGQEPSAEVSAAYEAVETCLSAASTSTT